MHVRTRWFPALSTIGLFTFAGCTVGPDFHPPRVEVPAAWIGTAAPPATAPTTRPLSVATTRPVEVIAWWSTFQDPVLESLVDRALDSNLDLRIATLRVRQARAARRVAAAGLWPLLDVAGSYRRSKSGDADSRNLFQAGLDASWEVDIFGGVRRNVEAATADVQSAVEDRRDVFVTLASEVALNYIDLRGFQRELDIARENLLAQRRSADVTRRRFQQGFEAPLDMANAEAQVASTESQIPVLEASARQVIYVLSVLLGSEPGGLLEELTNPAPIPATPPEVPLGLPSELLRRRPDIRRAEADLHAATARVGVATADLYPRFALNGSLGWSADKLANLTDNVGRSWSIGPSASWPLFDAGRIRATIDIRSAIQEEALLSYRATILTALQDVETALVAYTAEQQRRAFLFTAVAANRRAVDLSTRLYTAGEIEFINVLAAQQSLLSSESALVQSNRNMAANVVAIYKALGGGWEIESAVAPTP
jgi:NodT family efflux transporter outer membrane factor (OMF) lipoprotein